MNSKWLVFVFAAALLLTVALVYGPSETKEDYSDVQSFEDCVAAGLPVMESYPRQCKVPNGPSFTEVLSEEEQRKLVPPDRQSSELESCGDGICQSIVCQAIGCPIPETPQNCPMDCAE